MNNLLLRKGVLPSPKRLFFCKVINISANTNTANVVTIDNNTTINDCMIVCSMPQGFSFGSQYIPSYEGDVETGYIMSPADLYCVACYIDDFYNAVIIGFLPPKQTELSIPEYGLYLFRHESDVVLLLRADGTLQVYHPSGSYLKVGETDVQSVSSSIEAEGLYPARAKGFNVRDAQEFNQSSQMGMFLRFWAGQQINLSSDGHTTVIVKEPKAGKTVTIDLDGNLGSMTITTEGQITVNATEQITVNASSQVNVNAAGQTVTVTADQINLVKG